MININSEEYRIGLMTFAYKEIGFYGMCDVLSYSRPLFRRLSGIVRENMSRNEGLLVMEGYDKDSCNEFIYDCDRLTKEQALKMQQDAGNILNSLIVKYEKTLV